MNSKEILRDLGLLDICNESIAFSHSVNEKLQQKIPYRPEFDDLASLHSVIQKTSRTTIMEFGCGWSSLLFAVSLSKLKEIIGDMSAYRRNNCFECHSVDNQVEYIDIAKSRIPEGLLPSIQFHKSKVRMTKWNGRFVTEYQHLPLVNPDLVYLDGPDQFAVEGDVNGWSTRHKDMLPMSCDILKFEHFLIPKTIIIVDGRAANARFLRCNLQRNWEYKYCSARDQHFFVLEEPALGKHCKSLVSDIYYRLGEWTVKDL